MNKEPLISHLKLPFQFDEKKLVRDLKQISNMEWSSMYYTQNYDGEWKSLALYAPDGNATNAQVDVISTSITPTSVLHSSPYFKQVINFFKAPLLSARLLRLTPGSIIKPHKDFRLGYEDHNFRIHIPITTNKDVCFTLNSHKLIMNSGECWYTNVNFTHSVSNEGTIDRVHLVLDLERNTWSDEIFFSLAPKENFALNDVFSKEVLIQMIRELEFKNDPIAKTLINDYKKQLSAMP